jgi:hypothetical protein
MEMTVNTNEKLVKHGDVWLVRREFWGRPIHYQIASKEDMKRLTKWSKVNG